MHVLKKGAVVTEEQIKDIFSREIPYEQMEFIYSAVEANINKFIKNDAIKYKKDIEISFQNPWSAKEEPKYLHNACAEKVGTNKYEIYICPLLIKDLFRFAFYIAGYRGFRIQKSEKDLNMLAFHLLFNWLYFISLHEYSHVIMGHNDYKASTKSQIGFEQASTISEYIDTSMLTSDELIASQGMELEADSTAAELFFATILTVENHIKSAYENEYKFEDIIYDYLLGINFLFYFFYISRGDSKSRTHPLGSERALFFQGSILHSKDKLPKTSSFQEINIELIVGLATVEYLNFIGIEDKDIGVLLVRNMEKLKVFDSKNIRVEFDKFRLI